MLLLQTPQRLEIKYLKNKSYPIQLLILCCDLVGAFPIIGQPVFFPVSLHDILCYLWLQTKGRRWAEIRGQINSKLRLPKTLPLHGMEICAGNAPALVRRMGVFELDCLG